MKSPIVDFLFEASSLKRLKRTGWQILGDNEESIAEHVFMVCVISFVLAGETKADLEKVLLMALFHDFEESRTGDVYKLADLYTETDKKSAVKHAFSNLPRSVKITKLLGDYEKRSILEAKIVKDADTLALCLELKQLVEKGNVNAMEWLEANLGVLVLPESGEIGRELMDSNSQDWWKKERNKLRKIMTGK